MNLLTIQDNIKTQLGTLGLGYVVEDFPNRPEEYQLAHPVGAALVRYNGSTYERPTPNRKGQVVSVRRMEWAVTLVAINLFDNDGLYAKIEAVRAGLMGWTPAASSDLSVFYPVRDGFLQEKLGQWWYEIAFETIGPDQE